MLNMGKRSNVGMLVAAATANAFAALFRNGQTSVVPTARKRSWRDNVPTEVYRHQMITASPKEIAAWNKQVVAAKSKRRSDRYRRFSDARAALTRSAFDTLREYRHGLRNYVVAKAGG